MAHMAFAGLGLEEGTWETQNKDHDGNTLDGIPWVP